MDFRILGSLEVRDDGRVLPLGGGKQRALLALLLIHANTSISTDRLIDELWDEQPPPTAGKILHNYVSQLRRVLGDDRLQTQARGYALRVAPGELDLDRFRQSFEAGRKAQAAGDPERAALLLREALALWRGSPLADFAYQAFAREEIGRLEELQLNALVERIDADLALGRHVDVIGELETLVAQHPLQERLRGQLMLALYRSGRQAEALQVYQDARRTLAEELGLEPGQGLQRLEQSILTHDPTIEPPVSERPVATGARSGSRNWWAMLGNQRLLVAVLATAAVVGAAAAALFVLSDDSVSAAPITGNAVAIIDPDSNRVTGQVAVGAGPGALAVGNGSLWVANIVDQSVSRVDLATKQATRVIAVGGVPKSLATGRNAVWVVRRRFDGKPELIRIDPRFDLVAPGRRLLRGGDPQLYAGASVAAGPDGVWVGAEGGSLERLDPAREALTTSIDTGNSLASIAIGAGGVWVSDSHGNSVARIDPAQNLVTSTTPVGNGPDAMAVGEGAVWVADRRDGAVVRLDPATNSVTTTIKVGRGPTGIAVGLGSVWVANSRDGTVSRIDPERKGVVQTIRVGGSPRAIAIANGRVWVSVRTAIFDPAVRPDVLRVASPGIDSLDPALGYTFASWSIEYVTCAQLLNYPDRPAPVGSRLVPEVAAAMPVRSADGKSYTFTIRPGFRFSPPSNAPVTAQTFKFSIERALSPKIPDGQARNFAGDIVGVEAYEAGKAKHISGIRARGNTLTVRLTDASPDILSRLALPLFCPVPPDTPVAATGVNTVPSAGPYYVAAYKPEQGAVLKRNPNYHGSRPHVFDEIDYETGIGAAQSVPEIEAGTSDFGVVSGADLPDEQLASLDARYGPGSPAARAGRQRVFVNPLLGFLYVALNTSRPLFANGDLRKAVNYALDRRAIAGGPFNLPTDQFLEPGIPGFRDMHVYPLTPDLARAKQLARGHGGRAVLYAGVEPGARKEAQLVKAELALIGIDVQIKSFGSFAVYHLIGRRGEPFDLALTSWFPAYPDPSNILNYLFDGRSIRATANSNQSYFDDPAYNRKLAAAARLSGPQRYAAYQALEVDLLRNAAPAAPLYNFAEYEFFSDRIGCQVYHPVYQIDLAALCLKERR